MQTEAIFSSSSSTTTTPQKDKGITNGRVFQLLKGAIERKIEAIEQKKSKEHEYWQPKTPIVNDACCPGCYQYKDGFIDFFSWISPSLWCQPCNTPRSFIPFCLAEGAVPDGATMRTHNKALYFFTHILGLLSCGGCITGAVLTGLFCPAPSNIIFSTLLSAAAVTAPCTTDCVVSAEEQVLADMSDTYYEKKHRSELAKKQIVQRFEIMQNESLDIQSFCDVVEKLHLRADDIYSITKEMTLAQLYEAKRYSSEAFIRAFQPNLTSAHIHCLERIESILSPLNLAASAAGSSVNSVLLPIESFISGDSSVWYLLIERLPKNLYENEKQILLRLSPLEIKEENSMNEIRNTLIQLYEKIEICVNGYTHKISKQLLLKHSHFQALFNSGMQEAKANKLVLSLPVDQAAVFPQFIAFLEGRTIEICQETCMPLFQLADYFRIEALQKLCFASIKKQFLKLKNAGKECEGIQRLIQYGGQSLIEADDCLFLRKCTFESSQDALQLFTTILENKLKISQNFQETLVEKIQNPKKVATLLLRYHPENERTWNFIKKHALFSFSKTHPEIDARYHTLNSKEIKKLYNDMGFEALFLNAGPILSNDLWSFLKQDIDVHLPLFTKVWEFAEIHKIQFLKDRLLNYYENHTQSSEITCLWPEGRFPSELENVLIARFAHAFTNLSM